MPGHLDLWPLLRLTASATNIDDLSIKAYERDSRHGNGCIKLGIHVNNLLGQILADTRGRAIPPLRIFFLKLACYAKTPTIVVCVFDGPQCPAPTYGPNHHALPNSLIEKAKSIVKSFGFHVHQAPGDGRAELGALNAEQMLDYVITSDSNVFAFRAQEVLRSNSVKQTPEDHRKTIFHYSSAVMSLTAADCILIALMSGSEFSAGVGHCNRATARALANCGFGQTLAAGCVAHTGQDRHQFISSWLTSVSEELQTNSLRVLGGLHPTLADRLHENTFPSNEVIDLYLFPLTSFSMSAQGPDCASWIFGEGPRIDLLAAAAINHLEFKNSADLSRTFFYNIWRAVMVKTFLSPYQVTDPQTLKVASPAASLTVLEARRDIVSPQLRGATSDWVRIHMKADGFCHTLQAMLDIGIQGRHLKLRNIRNLSLDEIWVLIPRSYVPALIPVTN